MVPLEERFWGKVNKTDSCWVWVGSKNQDGYGRIWVQSEHRMIAAHRVSWSFIHGDIPNDMCVLHSCDNPACVNPSHLFIGTRFDNMQDCVQKKRHKCNFPSLGGESNTQARLTCEAVAEIRASRGVVPQAELSAKFGVSVAHISNIQRGKRWGRQP